MPDAPTHGARRLHQREDAPEQDGLHIAGIDGEFADVVQSDHPRCPECQVLYADGEDHGLCRSCKRAFRQAEEASRRMARLRQRREDGDAP